MRIEGAIYPIDDATAFSREAWCQLVHVRPEFRRYPPRQSPNPFTTRKMTVRTTPDAAEVVFDGRTVGAVYWSMSDEPLVNVSIEPIAMHLIQEWAAALSGEFRQNSPDLAGESGAPEVTI
jgi:hypothetical protein